MVELYIARNAYVPDTRTSLSDATVTLDAASFVYDGTLKTQNVTVTVGGQTLTQGTDYTIINNAYTNAGNYTLSVMGMGNYKGTKTANWSIAKATGSVSVNPSSLSISGANETATSTVTVVGDGTVSVSSSDSSIATASISNDTVTVTSVAGGSATITVTLAAGTNYTGNSATISVSVVTISPTLSDNTPEQIKAAAQAGIASTLWSVGDKTANISIGSFSGIAATTNIAAFILGFNHNSSQEGNGIHFQFGKTTNGTDICFYSLAMNSSMTNSGGWNGSNMRTTHCPAFLAALPSDWQAVIADCDKYSDNTGGGSDTASYVTKTTDKIFLLAEYEVFGARSYANSKEKDYQAQYAYYANGNSKIKYQHTSTGSACSWWLRSVHASSSNRFCSVYTSGSVYRGYADSGYGFAPGFSVA